MADTKIQKVIHSNGDQGLGLTAGGHLVNRGRFVSKTMRHLINFSDDFFGDVIADEWNNQVGSNAPAAAATNNQIGGAVRLTTGTSATVTMAVNGTQLSTGAFLNWKAENGGLLFQARVKVDTITTVALFIGFTDQDSALEMPFTLSAGTLTSNATDAVGFLFDTAATAATIKLVGVKNDVDATVQDTGVAFVAATYIDFSIEIDATGNAIFFINGAAVGSKMTSALTASIPLAPVVAGFSRAASVRYFDVDYIACEMHRTA